MASWARPGGENAGHQQADEPPGTTSRHSPAPRNSKVQLWPLVCRVVKGAWLSPGILAQVSTVLSLSGPEGPDPHPCGEVPGAGLHWLGGLFLAGWGFSSYFRLQMPLPSGRDLLLAASTLLQESCGNPDSDTSLLHLRHRSIWIPLGHMLQP